MVNASPDEQVGALKAVTCVVKLQRSAFFHEAIKTVLEGNRAQLLKYSANLRQLSQLSPELPAAGLRQYV